jgi:NADH-quinone oxidoreductase subunit H
MFGIDPVLIGQLTVILVVFFALQISAAVLVYMERKVAAFIQQRYGPYLVGPRGALQPIADVVKLLFKEELRPKAADRFLFYLAPVISAAAAFAAFAVVPFGAPTDFFGLLPQPINLAPADVNVGLLVIFAVTSMGVYGIVLAGWSSNSKYSLLGALRASAQMISYELSYGLSFAAVIMLAGSLSLSEIVNQQSGYWFGFIPKWYIFIQPIGFFIFLTAGVAETNRAPFDFPEAEQELVAGYHTEYSSMSFRAVLPGRVHQHGHGFGGGHRPVPRRMARTVPARVAGLDLVPAEGVRAAVLLYLDAVDAAAVPLRPAHGIRLEVAVAGRGTELVNHGLRGPQSVRLVGAHRR